jgi:hypothetical protein
MRSSNRKQFVTALKSWQDSATLVLDLDDQILLISEPWIGPGDLKDLLR